MFAKLFETPSTQILVKLDTAEVSGAPEIRLFFELRGCGVQSVALEYSDGPSGWAMAESAFRRMDKVEAMRGVAAACREMAP